MDEGIPKRRTDIHGLDQATLGGLPRGGATLIRGRAGAGKTVLAMEICARAAQRDEQTIFVSFEEPPSQLLANANAFAWAKELESDCVQLIDARPHNGGAVSGSFDLSGLRAVLDAAARRTDVAWVVLDGIDRILEHATTRALAFDEIRTLDEWSRERGVTVLLTAKSTEDSLGDPEFLHTIEFMLSTILHLSSTIIDRRLSRRFMIAKYRGSPHDTDELPMVIDQRGIQLPYAMHPDAPEPEASTERVETGVPALDEILGGGVYRGSTTLLSGAPGTSKTTLATAFANAAGQRGEQTLFLSFDEVGSRIVRNVASVGIDLQPHIDAGLLHLHSFAAWKNLVEQHVITIHRLLDEIRPEVLVIDPISAMLKAGGGQSAYLAIERLLGIAHERNVTTILTSLGDAAHHSGEATLSNTSTLADNWIALEYQITGGERNRALSIVKSRGTSHSNQVRELLLTDQGIDLADVYRYGTEVLLGTARLHAERRAAKEKREADRAYQRQIHELESALKAAKLESHAAAREIERLERLIEDVAGAHRANLSAAERHETDIVSMRKYGRSAVGEEPPEDAEDGRSR